MKIDSLYDYGLMPIHLGGSILCGVLLLSGWSLGLSPLLSDTQQASSVTEQADQAEKKAKLVSGELDRISAELNQAEKQLEQHPVNLLRASQINPLLAELAHWSELHQLSITRTSSGRAQALQYYDYVPIQITGEGRYGDLLAFMKRLHDERTDLGVITFGINRKDSGLGVTFEIKLAWYVISDDRGNSAGDEPRPTASVPTL